MLDQQHKRGKPPKNSAQHKQFTNDLIQALEEAQRRRDSQSPEALARSCWDNLQYDLPLVEPRELAALLDAFRGSLEGKSAWTPYQLTAKFVENTAAGARRCVSAAASSSSASAHASKSGALPAAAAAGSASSSSHRSGNAMQLQAATSAPAAAAASPAAAHAVDELGGLYQQLYAAIMLQYMSRVLALPDSGASAMLHHYAPEEEDDSSGADAGPPPPPYCAQAAKGEQLVAADPAAAAASPVLVEVEVLAPEQDGDDEAYEDLLPFQHAHAASRPSAGRSASAANGALLQHLQQHQQLGQAQEQPMGWPELQQRLLALAGQVTYALMDHPDVWRAKGGSQQLLHLLHSLASHAHAAELQPLLHAYVGVLADRLVAAPAELPLLEQLWEALGVPAPGSSSSSGGGGGGAAAASAWHGGSIGAGAGPLAPEASLALSVALSLGRQLPAGAQRQQLWRLVNARLLPLLLQCAEALAYAKAPRAASAAAAPGGHLGELVAGCCLVGSLAEWYVMAAPRAQQPGELMVSSGVLRALVALFVRQGAHAGAEPLRRALLLTAAASPAACNWAAAVPGMAALVGGADFHEGGPFEAHGAVWGLLLGSGGSGGSSLMASLLSGGAAPEKAARLHAALLLLADAHAAARGRPLWGAALEAQMRTLFAALRDERSCGAEGEHSVGSEQQPADDQAAAGDEDDPKVHSSRPQDAVRLKARQLQPACVKLLKDLLTQGGKTD